MRVRHEPAPALLSLRLHAMEHGLDRRRLRRQHAERLGDRRHLHRADGLADTAREADKEPELHREADLRLVVLVDVAGRGVELARAHGGAAMDEDPLPRDLHVVEPDQPVILVESRGERVVEGGERTAFIGLAREQAESLHGHRHREADRVVLLVRLQRLEVGHEQLVREHGRRAQHLAAPDRHAFRVLVHDAEHRAVAALLAGALRAVQLRIDDHIGEIEVAVARMGEIVMEGARALRVVRLEYFQPHDLPGDGGRQMVRRAAHEAGMTFRPGGERLAAAPDELLQRGRHLPGAVDPPAAARGGGRSSPPDWQGRPGSRKARRQTAPHCGRRDGLDGFSMRAPSSQTARPSSRLARCSAASLAAPAIAGLSPRSGVHAIRE